MASLGPGVASTGLEYSVHSVGQRSIKAENLLRGDLMHSSLQDGLQVLAISVDATTKLSANYRPQVLHVFRSVLLGGWLYVP